MSSNLYTKKGNPRKRKPKQNRDYFNQETEDAILAYVACSDQEERNKIYNKSIAHSFYKLAENIINTFDFDYQGTESLTDIIQECTFFILTKLHLYKQEKGKAYSYFGTIIKRYCIVWNENNYKKAQQQTVIEEESSEQSDEESSKASKLAVEEYSAENISEFLTLFVKYVDANLEDLFPKAKDLKTADAVMELFRKREDLEIFNKKALYIYIREIIDVDTPMITKIVNKLKRIYAELYNRWYEHGEL